MPPTHPRADAAPSAAQNATRGRDGDHPAQLDEQYSPLPDPSADDRDPDHHVRDIADLPEHLTRLQTQLDALREGLTHSHRLATLGTLASVVAHEYNNILTPVVSYAQLALARPDDHELMRKAVEKALAGAERAARISSSLLGFAQPHAEGRVAPLPETVDEALACLARSPQRDGIELELDLPSASVAMSPINLQQVLVNLVLNARRAMRPRGGRLTIRGRVCGDRLHLTVRDTGPGIPPAIMDRLFEPFVTHRIQPDADVEAGEAGGQQARQADPHNEPRGTGLGLCICRELVESVGGSIRAESAVGKGAAFHIELPLTASSAEAESDSSRVAA